MPNHHYSPKCFESNDLLGRREVCDPVHMEVHIRVGASVRLEAIPLAHPRKDKYLGSTASVVCHHPKPACCHPPTLTRGSGSFGKYLVQALDQILVLAIYPTKDMFVSGALGLGRHTWMTAPPDLTEDKHGHACKY